MGDEGWGCFRTPTLTHEKEVRRQPGDAVAEDDRQALREADGADAVMAEAAEARRHVLGAEAQVEALAADLIDIYKGRGAREEAVGVSKGFRLCERPPFPFTDARGTNLAAIEFVEVAAELLVVEARPVLCVVGVGEVGAPQH